MSEVLLWGCQCTPHCPSKVRGPCGLHPTVRSRSPWARVWGSEITPLAQLQLHGQSLPTRAGADKGAQPADPQHGAGTSHGDIGLGPSATHTCSRSSVSATAGPGGVQSQLHCRSCRPQIMGARPSQKCCFPIGPHGGRVRGQPAIAAASRGPGLPSLQLSTTGMQGAFSPHTVVWLCLPCKSSSGSGSRGLVHGSQAHYSSGIS